ncbi:prepilin-type N-terminal cleavage/methylation domain-containing protein [Paenibacillus puerhi]|uniref:prepilin-type N-terminal cleavage/methylation domain-containing protein n=1 Tax=Paenibacillus puerhi TaxID=2692622 RepID=UPI001356C00E|nr:prepilin-type N-terminal cleavage/methylation domain-containing protein [Paenibacillus puerhi]
MMKINLRNQNGFTLVELLAAILLVGIIAGVITMALSQLSAGNQVTFARQQAQAEARAVTNHMIGKLREQKYDSIAPTGTATAERKDFLTLYETASRTDNLTRYYLDIPGQAIMVETVRNGASLPPTVLARDVTEASTYFLTQDGQTSSASSSHIQVKYLHLQFQLLLLANQKGKQQTYAYKTDITIPSWDQ